MDPATLASETVAYARELRALYRSAEQRAVRFRLLVEMGRHLSNTRDPEALLRLALLRATTFSGYDLGAVLLVGADGVARTAATLDLNAPGSSPSLPQSALDRVGQALGHGQALLWAETIEPAAPGGLPQSLDRLILPLQPSEGRPLGALLLVATSTVEAPDSDDLEALQLLAAQLAGALRSAELHEEQAQLVGLLREREQRLSELVEQLIHAQDEERRRVAYDLHDGLSQMILGVLQQLHVLSDSYRPRSPRARVALGRAVEMARATVAEARRVIAGLRPTVLDDFGLAQAIQLQVETLRRDGWEVRYDQGPGVGLLTPAQETALFRIAQEALNNVRKHAGSTPVRVALRQSDGAVVLAVEDWGRGFSAGPRVRPPEAEGGVGLASIGERVKLLGGQWRVVSQPGAGTLVEVSLPLRAEMGEPYDPS